MNKQCEKIAHADGRIDLYPNPAIIYIPFWTRTQSPFCAKIKFPNCFLYLLQTYNFIQVLHILKTAPKLKSNYWNTRVRFNMFNFVSIKFAFRLTTSQRMQCYNFRMRGFSQLHTHYTHRDTLKWPQIYVYVSGDMFAVHPIDSHGTRWFIDLKQSDSTKWSSNVFGIQNAHEFVCHLVWCHFCCEWHKFGQ